MNSIAILYQNEPPPPKGGIQKPLKPGGYSDSGADIGFCLHENGYHLITPNPNPEPLKDYDWVFPDSKKGIEAAMESGANIFWLNTVLFKGHPIAFFFDKNIEIVGQLPELVDKFDDKIIANRLLEKNSLPIPSNLIIEKGKAWIEALQDIQFPQVIKPIRGRGSQGISVVNDKSGLIAGITTIFESNHYGESVYIEHFLPGQEVTITVMPPGEYELNSEIISYQDYWTLPPVKRFNHLNGIAPYNGLVAVVDNSQVLSDDEMNTKQIELVRNHCKKAAKLVQAKAPIRIDCRADNNGKFYLFDLNMKPNMTGAARNHRQNQDSLTMIAARKIGWTYIDLLKNILNQKWKPATKSL